MISIHQCGHYWWGNGGSDNLVGNNSHTRCLMIAPVLLTLPLELPTKSMQPFKEISVLSVLAKDGTQGINIH